ncbi:MAG: hypothetical protein O3B17_07650 [Actinomycetota bacterium]|nr:hypothetical protein [Actinomycetota bacterium]
MKLDKDFNEFVELFVAKDVRFLVVGGYALAAHGYPRATDDFDAWVWANSENAEKIVECLAEFGFGSLNLSTGDFTTLDQVVQLGYPPYRIDIITSISGVEFESAWANRLLVDVDGMQVPFIGRDDLLRNKRATGRPKDLLDVERLTGN